MEAVFDARAMIRKGVVVSIDDTGPAQMVTVQTSAGAIHTAEVIQPYGCATVPPVNGCEAVVLGVGGDPANMVALLINPARRFGGMAIGETVLYGSGGSRVAIRSGGTIQVLGFAAVTTDAPLVSITAATSVTITAPDIALNGTVTVTGQVNVTGAITTTGTIHAGGGIV